MKYLKRLFEFLEDEVGEYPAFSYEILELTEKTDKHENYDVLIKCGEKQWQVDFQSDEYDLSIRLGEDYKNVSHNNSDARHFWMALLDL